MNNLINSTKALAALRPISLMRRPTHGLAWLLLLLMLSACQPHSLPNLMTDYRERLARVLKTPQLDALELQLRPLDQTQYPDKSQLQFPVDSVTIELTAFYQLQQCELGVLVGQRNTTLGKTMLPSQQLVYEAQLLSALPSCIRLAQAAPPSSSLHELHATLRDWQAQKRQNYPYIWRNMLVLSNEVKAALTRPKTHEVFAISPEITSQLSHFRLLSQSRDHRTVITRQSAIEQALQAVDKARLPATMWALAQQLTQQLTPLTNALQQPLSHLDCSRSQGQQQAQILRNVFYLFFIEQIQPLGGHINNFHYQFTPLFDQWLADEALPKPFKDYIATQQHAFNAYQQALSEHVTLWQQFLARCHLSPTAT